MIQPSTLNLELFGINPSLERKKEYYGKIWRHSPAAKLVKKGVSPLWEKRWRFIAEAAEDDVSHYLFVYRSRGYQGTVGGKTSTNTRSQYQSDAGIKYGDVKRLQCLLSI